MTSTSLREGMANGMHNKHVKSAIDTAREGAQEVEGAVRQKASEVKEVVYDAAKRVADEIKDRGSRAFGDLQDLGTQQAKALEAQVKKYPLNSVMLAAGAGFLFGFLWRSR